MRERPGEGCAIDVPSAGLAPPPEASLNTVLRDVFGHDAFRRYQEEVVRSVLAGRDAFVVLPTGGGKSLCYQLPARLLPGVCLVVSPLISLMKDQVDAATAKGIAAAYLNSSQAPAEQKAVLHRLMSGDLDLLYVAPERFPLPGFLDVLERIRLCLIAIDEAHCISMWGHDFRPDYLALPDKLRRFPGVPVAAFTATATLRVQQDIVTRLNLRAPLQVRASFNRPNLRYEVRRKNDVERQILRYVAAQGRRSGIVYRTTRCKVEETARALAREGLRALPYHAGLDADTRRRNQEAFDRGDTDVIVATIAFGMGIDKPDIRYVVHGELPKNLESYYQETGRAGRDGAPAHCLLFFDWNDVPILEFFIEKVRDDRQRRIAERKLDEMIRFVESRECRRRQLLAYFDERYAPANCGNCDRCLPDQGIGTRPPAQGWNRWAAMAPAMRRAPTTQPSRPPAHEPMDGTLAHARPIAGERLDGHAHVE